MNDDLGIDGAAAGIDPATALRMMFTGEPPAPGDRTDLPDMLATVLALPIPGEAGSDPWGNFTSLDEMSDEQADKAYSATALIIVRGFLRIHELQPLEHFDEESLWARFLDNYADWAADVGPSGFQVGYAMNLFRALVGEPTAGNPAVMTVD